MHDNSHPAPSISHTLLHLVRDVRALRGSDVAAIVRGTPRPLGRCVQVVVGQEALAGHAAPGVGRGLLCALQDPRGMHVVSVFRCGDGRFLYYDPTPRPVYPAFDAFCRYNGIGKKEVTVMRAYFQRPGFKTCAYHALTFLDYVTWLDQDDSWLVIAYFKRHMGNFADMMAISTVQGLLREFPNSLSLSTTQTAGASPVFVPDTPFPSSLPLTSPSNSPTGVRRTPPTHPSTTAHISSRPSRRQTPHSPASKTPAFLTSSSRFSGSHITLSSPSPKRPRLHSTTKVLSGRKQHLVE